MTSRPERQPRIVLAVANNIAADARVRKYVETAVLAGADVTVVGVSDGNLLEEGQLGGARLLRVPVRYRLRRHAAKARDPKLRTERMQAAAQQLRADERELSARIGDLKAEGRQAHRLRRWRIARTIEDLREEAAERRSSFDSWMAEERRAIDELRAIRERPLEAAPRPRSPIDWRAYAPEFLDLEIAVGPVIDDLEADVLHAHDVHLLGVLARSKRRRAGAGQSARLVYDAHEFIPGLFHPDPRYVDALASMEAEFIPDCDHVVAVSDRVAAELQARHGLAARPTVVHNAPVIGRRAEGAPTIRELTGVSADDVLLVYSGGVNPGRGLEVLVDALGLLPSRYHAAIVTNRPRAAYTVSLRERAREVGVAERFHVVEFVPPSEVVEFLRSADIGIDPMRPGWRNHEWTLPNKLFEYTAAGLALVVSDLEEIAKFVTEHGLGVAFRSEEAADLARAVQEVTPHRHEIRASHEQNWILWSDQVESIVQLYRDATGADLEPAAPTELPEPTFDQLEEASWSVDVDGTVQHSMIDRDVRLAIGPTNAAGQAWAWKLALEAAGAASVEVFTLEHDAPYEFPTDHMVSTEDWGSLDWQLAQTRRILTTFSHVLFEFGRPILGRLHSQHFDGDARMLAAHGIHTGAICHGSDVRDPDVHAELEQYSPFRDCDDDFREGFARRTRHLRQLLDEVGLPTFVTTVGLVDSVPTATWLPLAIDMDRYRDAHAAGRHGGRLRVGHFPTRGIFKGSGHVDRVCGALEAEGVIEYIRLSGIPARRIPEVLDGVDVLVDGLVLGDYGVLACEAMAARRAVVGNVGDRVRSRLPLDLPIVHTTPDTLEAEVRRLAGDRDAVLQRGDAGRSYVDQVHSGALSVAALAPFLDSGQQ